ncbi:hypothetical protein A3C89_01490 [Candidatus Kaiserbacteria bacterium RIFCSPHIGHO2_02_FULL_50_50]|uniref:histidine kinase n=1 Tax=Candidatus Kaiserbacteria bacterium RIFCSPHIGHO2_02_FULL_50_50 TaxID=1798492 RepID=A0A1F6DC96_9BACT|nr:MAG: hypothetical protein A3C89_01490 [Candidatus Kaiserbacteria bacterium RIFCSPHIGHO2_02_FULL_50_50]OGG89315.1 MAG: hypothetical protein A3G62_01565 [Candidatus Kaiserbacteria bacterium RIFCSPLOWO2_12_FULL_50_10]
MRDIILTCISIATIVDLVLLAVLIRDRTAVLRAVFTHLIAGTLLWNISIFWLVLVRDTTYVPLVYFAALYFIMSRYIFIANFTSDVPAREERILVVITCLFGILAFVPGALFSDPVITADGYVLKKNGWFTLPFALFTLYMTLRPLQQLTRYCLHHRTQQVIVLTFGMSLYAIVTISSNLILPVFFDVTFFNTIGPAFSTVFTLIVLYAMSRYQFLHIKLLIQRGIIFAALYGFALTLYSIIASTLVFVTRNTFHSSELVVALTILVAALFVPSLELLLRRITDRFLLQQTYSYDTASRTLATLFAQNVTTRTILGATLAYMKATLRVVSMRYHKGAILPDDVLVKNSVFPVHASTGIIGYILVGQKKSHDPLTHTDREILEFYVIILGIALEKARLFEHLGDEVTARTNEIARIHEEARANLAMLAHDLKTPLTVLLGTHELISSSPEISRERFDALALPLRNITRTINEIVRFESHTPVPKTELNLSRLVEGAAEHMSVLCDMEDITFTSSVAQGVFLRGEERSLELMISNVLSNAIRYRSAETPTISLTLTEESRGATLVIADNGIGIPADALPKLFVSGYRARNALSRDGSGTGLATAQKIARHHEAAISVESTEGVGTTVTIRFQTSAQRLP